MQPTNTIRFESFSDGVFAIAVTLLALELRVPYLQPSSFSFQDIEPLIPSLLTFILSFIAIAIFWVNHHQLTQVITRITQRRILWVNMMFLLFVTLIPFVTQIMSVNSPSKPAVSMYALVLFGASISFTLLRYCIHRSSSPEKIPMKRSFIGPSIYLLAIVAPIFSLPLGYVLLAIPPLFYFLPKSSVPSL